MKNLFVPYEEASALKELGFNEPCIAYYTLATEKLCNASYTNDDVEFKRVTLDEIYKDYCLAPTWQQAIDWFRKKFELIGIPEISDSGYGDKVYYDWSIYHYNKRVDSNDTDAYKIEEMDQLPLAILKKLIECKLKNKIPDVNTK